MRGSHYAVTSCDSRMIPCASPSSTASLVFTSSPSAIDHAIPPTTYHRRRVPSRHLLRRRSHRTQIKYFHFPLPTSSSSRAGCSPARHQAEARSANSRPRHFSQSAVRMRRTWWHRITTLRTAMQARRLTLPSVGFVPHPFDVPPLDSRVDRLPPYSTELPGS